MPLAAFSRVCRAAQGILFFAGRVSGLAALLAAVSGAQPATDYTIDTVMGEGGGTGLLPQQLNSPDRVAVDGSGNLYIADRRNHRIQKVAADGTITTVAGTGTAGFSGDGSAATAAQLNYPVGVAVDGSGNL